MSLWMPWRQMWRWLQHLRFRSRVVCSKGAEDSLCVLDLASLNQLGNQCKDSFLSSCVPLSEVRVVVEINNQSMVERVTFGPMHHGRMDV